MEHQHMTEFASVKYFQKLEEEAKQRATAAAAESSTTTHRSYAESQFILPLRGSHDEFFIAGKFRSFRDVDGVDCIK